ncbi:3490_t:CDS:2, partial [Cetraspora pellucida]
IGILLENSASNNCYSATIPDLMDIVNSIDQRLRFSNKEKTRKRIRICFDTQHYYAAERDKRIDKYRNIYNMYGYEIIVTHVNNSLLEMIAEHKEVYAIILEIPSSKSLEQIAQIHKFKEKDQELKQHKENYRGISTVPIEMQFEKPAIIDLAKQIICMMIHIQSEQPNNNAQRRLNQQIIQDVQDKIKKVLQEQKRQDSKEIENGLRQLKYRLQTIEDNYKYVSNLPDKEVESHLEIAEKAAKVKINNKEEDRKKALYDVI